MVDAVRRLTGARHLLGATGARIIGRTQEVEGAAAVSLLVAELPGVEITLNHVTQSMLEEASGVDYWHFQLATEPRVNPFFLLVADPFTIEITGLVQQLGDAYPQSPLVGGLASGARQPGEHRLVLDDQILDEGAVCVSLHGAMVMHTLVAHGCKPIGQPLTITRAERNIIFEMGGQPPLRVLQQLLPQLPDSDRQLAQTALTLGRVINEYQEDFRRGDFLIRNLLGHDPQSGALAVGDMMRTGQTVQFQVRDRQTADEDLRAMLAAENTRLAGRRAQGVLLFSCLGRGRGMYGEAGHEGRVITEELGTVPLAGFFCNGEIGPVGGRPFVHGFTSVIAVFIEKE